MEVHHLIVDGFSLKKIASKEDYNPVPYHNYRQIIESNCETEHLKNDVKESFDLSEYRRNEFISSGVLDIDINVIRKISRELNVSHESIFATAYISAMNLERAVVCTPTNLRKLPEDYCVTGPLINLIGFKVLIQNYDKKNSILNTEKFLSESLSSPYSNLENEVNADIFMTHLVTVFDSYNSESLFKIDYEISNSLYDDQFKFNTYVYDENNVYRVYINSYYKTKEGINSVLSKMNNYIYSIDFD